MRSLLLIALALLAYSTALKCYEGSVRKENGVVSAEDSRPKVIFTHQRDQKSKWAEPALQHSGQQGVPSLVARLRLDFCARNEYAIRGDGVAVRQSALF